MELSVMFIALVVFLALGVPIAYAIGGSGILYMLLANPSFLLTMPQRVWSGAESFIIIAMPLFMLTGELMNHSGLTRRLINFAMLSGKANPRRVGRGEYCRINDLWRYLRLFRRRHLGAWEYPHSRYD